jgi:hypothetical protein
MPSQEKAMKRSRFEKLRASVNQDQKIGSTNTPSQKKNRARPLWIMAGGILKEFSKIVEEKT